jgi:glutamate 5-kinase
MGTDPMTRATPPDTVTGRTIAARRRIVVKVGSSLLVDKASGALNTDWLATLPEDLKVL